MNLQFFASGPVTTRSISSERRDYDVSKQIARLYPDATPFAVLLMEAKKEKVGSNYFYWWDQRLAEWWGTVTQAVLATDTEIPVLDASIFIPKDIVKIPSTGEVMSVVSIDTTSGANKITVTRGYGTTAAEAIESGAKIMRIASAMEEFSHAPESRIVQPTKGENYTQIFRTTFDQSMTSSNESLKTSESERVRLRKDKAVEHRIDIERAALFGEPKQDPKIARQTMGGLLHFIEGNFVDAQGTFDEDVFDTYCEQLFKHGSNKKILVCSNQVGGKINKFAKDRIQTSSGEETYGLRLKYITTFWGDLYLSPSKVLEHDYAGLAIGVDMDNIKYRPFRDTTLKTNIQAPDADGWMDEYLTEASLMVRLPETHCYLKNAV